MLAVISGASKGLGRVLATSFAKDGYSLALTSRNQQELETLQSELQRNYACNVFIKACDASNKIQVTEFADDVLNRFQTIDVLINNVGKYDVDSVLDDDADLDSMMRTNLDSAYYLTQKLAAQMCFKKTGHIFNICSVLSFTVRPNAAAYTISKHALKGFNDVLREELREYNVKVTAIYPGSINTSSWEGIIAQKELFIQPDDIAKTIKTCLSISKNANIEEIVIKPLDKKY